MAMEKMVTFFNNLKNTIFCEDIASSDWSAISTFFLSSDGIFTISCSLFFSVCICYLVHNSRMKSSKTTFGRVLFFSIWSGSLFLPVIFLISWQEEWAGPFWILFIICSVVSMFLYAAVSLGVVDTFMDKVLRWSTLVFSAKMASLGSKIYRVKCSLLGSVKSGFLHYSSFLWDFKGIGFLLVPLLMVVSLPLCVLSRPTILKLRDKVSYFVKTNCKGPSWIAFNFLLMFLGSLIKFTSGGSVSASDKRAIMPFMADSSQLTSSSSAFPNSTSSSGYMLSNHSSSVSGEGEMGAVGGQLPATSTNANQVSGVFRRWLEGVESVNPTFDEALKMEASTSDGVSTVPSSRMYQLESASKFIKIGVSSNLAGCPAPSSSGSSKSVNFSLSSYFQGEVKIPRPMSPSSLNPPASVNPNPGLDWVNDVEFTEVDDFRAETLESDDEYMFNTRPGEGYAPEDYFVGFSEEFKDEEKMEKLMRDTCENAEKEEVEEMATEVMNSLFGPNLMSYLSKKGK